MSHHGTRNPDQLIQQPGLGPAELFSRDKPAGDEIMAQPLRQVPETFRSTPEIIIK
jgi:hypothetical protein